MNNLLSGRSGVKRQERNMKKKRLVDRERMAKKRARNAITALGHFLTLVCQVHRVRNLPTLYTTYSMQSCQVSNSTGPEIITSHGLRKTG